MSNIFYQYIPLSSNLTNSIQSLTNVNFSAEDDVCKDSYNKDMTNDTLMSQKDSSNFEQVGDNLNQIATISKKLKTGENGCRKFVKSVSKCTDENGVKQDRYIYVDTISDGGIIKGIFGNTQKAFNFNFFGSLSDTCVKTTLPVGPKNSGKSQTRYMLKSEAENEQMKALETSGFTSYADSLQERHLYSYTNNYSLKVFNVVIVLWLSILILKIIYRK